jgi:hypothetical protein
VPRVGVRMATKVQTASGFSRGTKGGTDGLLWRSVSVDSCDARNPGLIHLQLHIGGRHQYRMVVSSDLWPIQCCTVRTSIKSGPQHPCRVGGPEGLQIELFDIKVGAALRLV